VEVHAIGCLHLRGGARNWLGAPHGGGASYWLDAPTLLYCRNMMPVQPGDVYYNDNPYNQNQAFLMYSY